MVLPGWGSIPFTGWASNFFFWVSIAALVLLGIAEAISHFYGDRHDSLVAAQYRQDKYGTDSEMTRLRKETAEANLKTEELRAKFAWRIMNKEQFQTLVGVLADMRPQLEGKLATWFYNSDESANFAMQIEDAITKAGYQSRGGGSQSGGKIMFYGVRVENRYFPDLAKELLDGLKRAGIEATLGPVETFPFSAPENKVTIGISVKPPP